MYGTTIVESDPTYVRDTLSWVPTLANMFGKECSNNAVSGNGNTDILNSFFDVLPFIKENDLVIIGWSNPHRFFYPGQSSYNYNFTVPHEIPDRLAKLLELNRELTMYDPEYIVRKFLDDVLLVQNTCIAKNIRLLQCNSIVDVTQDINIAEADWNIVNRYNSVYVDTFWGFGKETLPSMLGRHSNIDTSTNPEEIYMDRSKAQLWSEPNGGWHHPSVLGHKYIAQTLHNWMVSNAYYIDGVLSTKTSEIGHIDTYKSVEQKENEYKERIERFRKNDPFIYR